MSYPAKRIAVSFDTRDTKEQSESFQSFMSEQVKKREAQKFKIIEEAIEHFGVRMEDVPSRCSHRIERDLQTQFFYIDDRKVITFHPYSALDEFLFTRHYDPSDKDETKQNGVL